MRGSAGSTDVAGSTNAAGSTKGAGSTSGAGATNGWRRRRGTFAVVGFLLLALVVAVWAQRDGERYEDPLDPRNPGPDGGQALAKVLERNDVEVTIARSAAELEEIPVDRDTTVVVTGAERLSPSTAEHLENHAASGRLVVVDPPFRLLDGVNPLTVTRTTDADVVEAACDDPAYDDLTIAVDSATLYGHPGCFAVGSGHLLVTGDSGIVYLGAAEALANDQVLREDNAALGLRLLGDHERLVWYLPAYGDAAGDEAVSLGSLLPDWLRPALWMAALAAVGLVLWRFRRLGPLSTEPLPVVVRAVETAHSRGRMYRKANDRTHAAAVLRAGARRQAAEWLGLARSTPPGAVVEAVAHQTGRSREEVASLLGDPAVPAAVPATDRQLVQLAEELTRLIREVRRG